MNTFLLESALLLLKLTVKNHLGLLLLSNYWTYADILLNSHLQKSYESTKQPISVLSPCNLQSAFLLPKPLTQLSHSPEFHPNTVWKCEAPYLKHNTTQVDAFNLPHSNLLHQQKHQLQSQSLLELITSSCTLHKHKHLCHPFQNNPLFIYFFATKNSMFCYSSSAGRFQLQYCKLDCAS